MQDLYDAIRKSMFSYFCKHHSHLIEERFEVPRRMKISKKSLKSNGISKNLIENDIDGNIEFRMVRPQIYEIIKDQADERRLEVGTWL